MARVSRVRSVLAERTDGPVTNKQLARVLGMPEAKVDLYLSAGLLPKSLEDGVQSSGLRADHECDLVLGDILEDNNPTHEDDLMKVKPSSMTRMLLDSHTSLACSVHTPNISLSRCLLWIQGLIREAAT